jgi:hypothetical protein
MEIRPHTKETFYHDIFLLQSHHYSIPDFETKHLQRGKTNPQSISPNDVFTKPNIQSLKARRK